MAWPWSRLCGLHHRPSVRDRFQMTLAMMNRPRPVQNQGIRRGRSRTRDHGRKAGYETAASTRRATRTNTVNSVLPCSGGMTAIPTANAASIPVKHVTNRLQVHRWTLSRSYVMT